MKLDRPCQVMGRILVAETGQTPSNIRRFFQWKKESFVSAAPCPDATMDDIIAFNLKFNAENGHPFGPQEEAEKMMRGWFPTLKRWRKE